ncbi:hypothetical protein [Dactylosporangium sp. NPDC051541]|uniref:hypothetical protein n=1 Tax=Dactylosporangium sp. NPDC051541 TaxID=3363977 RepID=UPI0037AF73D5
MDGRRNFSPDPDADSRWQPDGRGYDDRGYDGRPDERSRGSRSRDEAERGYGDDRGYTPTRYADEREHDDGGYRVPEPRVSGRGFGAESPSYGDSPSGQFSAPGGTGEFSGEYVSRSRRSEAIDRSALQRPVSGGGIPGGTPGAPGGMGPGGMGMGTGAPIPGLHTSGSPIHGLPTITPAGPVSGAPIPSGPVSGVPGSGAPSGMGTSAFAAPTALTAAVPPPQQRPQFGPAEDPGGAVYRSKRPGLAVALGLLTALFEVPVLRLFFEAMTAKDIVANGTLAGIFMIPALPMFALGLYGLIGGAAAAAPGVRPWLRTPLVYLPIGMLLFIAAGLAA